MSNKKREIRVTGWHVMPEGDPLYGSLSFNISIADEVGGEFLRITDGGGNVIGIEPEEWPTLRMAIDRAIANCRDVRQCPEIDKESE